MNKLLTVIIPTYKKEELFKEAIDSVFIQNYPSIELIITDDGSPNYSRCFVEGLVTNPPSNIKNIQIIHHEKNLGTVRNLNYAIKQSQGYYISIIGSDDIYYAPNTLSKLVKDLADSPVIIGVLNIHSTNNTIHPINSFLSNFLPSIFLYYKTLIIGSQYSMPGIVFTRSLIDSLGGFDERNRYIEDYPFWLKILRQGIRVKTVPYTTVKYRTNGISSVRKIMRQEEYNIITNELEHNHPDTLWGKFMRKNISARIYHQFADLDTKKHGAPFSMYFISYKLIKEFFNVFSNINGNSCFVEFRKLVVKFITKIKRKRKRKIKNK